MRDLAPREPDPEPDDLPEEQDEDEWLANPVMGAEELLRFLRIRDLLLNISPERSGRCADVNNLSELRTRYAGRLGNIGVGLQEPAGLPGTNTLNRNAIRVKLIIGDFRWTNAVRDESQFILLPQTEPIITKVLCPASADKFP